MKNVIKVTVVNFNAHWGNKEHNLQKILEYSEIAAKEGSNIILFPETALTGYDDVADTPRPEKMQTLLAEPVPGPSTEKIAEFTKKYGVYVVFGMSEKDKEDPEVVYNSAAIVGPDGIVGSFQKIAPYGAENNWAERGKSPCVFDTPWGPIGVAICYDTYMFPELARYARAKGARLMLNPTALAYPYCMAPGNRTAIEAMVITNYMYVASANLCGNDEHQNFWGGSHIVGPNENGQGVHYYGGTPFYTEAGHQVEMHSATIDLSYADECMAFCPIFKKDQFIVGKPSSPDFQPEVYIKAYSELLNDEKWLALYDEGAKPKN